MMNKTKCIMTGCFDPFTIGHLNILSKVVSQFDEIYVVALNNIEKTSMFSLEERKRIIEESVSQYKNVIADCYDGLTVDYMHSHGITTIIRGVRNETDMAYEENLSKIMESYDNEFRTIIVKCDEKFSGVSSTIVREKIRNEENFSSLVCKNVSRIIEDFRK